MMTSIVFSKEFSKKLTLIFSVSYALASLVLFIDLFFLFLLGKTVQVQEPNLIIAFVEMVSAILAILVLSASLIRFLAPPKSEAAEISLSEYLDEREPNESRFPYY